MHSPENTAQTNESLPPIVGNELRGAAERHGNRAEMFEQEGSRLLSEHLAVVAEQGPDSVKAYMADLLADTDEKAPRAERAALFASLSERQSAALRNEVIETGAAMTGNLRENDRKYGTAITADGNKLRAGANTLTDAHKRSVGRAFNGGIDARTAARGHQEVAQYASNLTRTVTEYPQRTRQWYTAQAGELTGFNDRMQASANHQHALHKAAETLTPDYQGEAKDLSLAITETVQKQAAEHICRTLEAARKDGDNPEAVITGMLQEQTDATRDNETITALKTFSTNYGNLLRTGIGKTDSTANQMALRLKRFISTGQTNYAYARRVEDVAMTYRQQNGTLQEVSQAGMYMATSMQEILRASEQAVRTIDARLTRIG